MQLVIAGKEIRTEAVHLDAFVADWESLLQVEMNES